MIWLFRSLNIASIIGCIALNYAGLHTASG